MATRTQDFVDRRRNGRRARGPQWLQRGEILKFALALVAVVIGWTLVLGAPSHTLLGSEVLQGLAGLALIVVGVRMDRRTT